MIPDDVQGLAAMLEGWAEDFLAHSPSAWAEAWSTHLRLDSIQLSELASQLERKAHADHIALQSHIARRLGDYLEIGTTSTGCVSTELRIRVAGQLYSPDVAFYCEQPSHDELNQAQRSPDLTVDIRKPGDEMTALRDRSRLSAKSGTRVVLVIDPEARTVEYFDDDGHWQSYHGSTVLPLEQVLDGYPRGSGLSADSMLAVMSDEVLDTPGESMRTEELAASAPAADPAPAASRAEDAVQEPTLEGEPAASALGDEAPAEAAQAARTRKGARQRKRQQGSGARA